jgi:hypothetical protein
MSNNNCGSVLAITCASLLVGCGGGRSTAPTFAVGVTVSGLSGAVVLDNSFTEHAWLTKSDSDSAASRGLGSAGALTEELSVTVDGDYSFSRHLPSGASYSIAVLTQPSNEICTVTNGTGSIGSADVTGISVTCLTKRFTTSSVVTALDSSVPGAIAAKIAKVVSTAANARLGSALEVPVSPSGGETLVYAVDVNENTVLAATVSSAQVTLGADSTALALSRVLLGAIPGALKPADVDAAIRGTAAFPRLVTLINAALAAGTSPLASVAVFDTLNTVTSQVPSTVLTQLTAVGRREPDSKAHVASLASSPSASATANAVAERLSSWRGSSIQAVFLVAADSVGDVKLANGMSIAWAASTSDSYGNRRCLQGNGRIDRCSVLLPAAAVVRPTEIPASELLQGLLTQDVPGNMGSAVKLTLSQNDDSRKANIMHVVADGIRSTLAGVSSGNADHLAENCVNDLAAIMLPSEQLEGLGANRSSVNFQKYLDTIGTGAEVENALTEKLATCFGGSYASTHNVPAFSRVTLIFLRQFGLWVTRDVATVVNAANTGLEMGLTLYYWNDSGTTKSVSQGHVLAAPPNRRR